MVEFKKVNNGYDSNYKYWNSKTEKHEALYTITKENKTWKTKNNKTLKTIGEYDTLNNAKQAIEMIEIQKPKHDEIEEGFATGGGWSGAVWITSDGKGGSWHKDENGNIIND